MSRPPEEDQPNRFTPITPEGTESLFPENPTVTFEDIIPSIVNMEPGQPPFRVRAGFVEIDETRLQSEIEGVKGWLLVSIQEGNERTRDIFLRSVDDRDEGAQDLRERIRVAFETRDPNGLGLSALHINSAIGGIAERNIMREGLKPEIQKLPFSYRDRAGNEIPQDEIDVVFAKDSKGDYRFIIGSQKGIASIVFPDDIPQDKFSPDMAKADKDEGTQTITIPLKGAKNGASPSAQVIEVRKGAINVAEAVDSEDRQRILKDQRDEERRREREAQRQSSSRYTPPPASSYSGESRWVSSSSN